MKHKLMTVTELQKDIGNKTATRIYQVVKEKLTKGDNKDYYRSGNIILLTPSGVKKVKAYFKSKGKTHISPEHTKKKKK